MELKFNWRITSFFITISSFSSSVSPTIVSGFTFRLPQGEWEMENGNKAKATNRLGPMASKLSY